MKSLSSFLGPINGPVVSNPSVTHVVDGNAITHAIICLHGFGSSGDDLIALAEPLQLSLGKLAENNPVSLAVYAPHGPAPTPDGYGRQWFRDMGWTFRDPDGLARLTNDLDAFIADVTQAHGIPTANIVLLGFSQGAMSSLYAFPLLKNRPAAVISCCGALTVTPTFPPNPNPEPILFIHGQDDDVLPADTSVQAAQTFQSHGYPTQVEILPDLGHGIDGRTLAHIAAFLNELWFPNP